MLTPNIKNRNRILSVAIASCCFHLPQAVADEDETVTRRVIEEVVVTANRRDQSIQDVPNSLKVLDGAAMEKAGVQGFEDYVFSIPGVDLGKSGTEKRIAIRGIGNLGTNPSGPGGSPSPIAIYLNDTPIQGNGVLPDMTLYDLRQIEVLKGPQGTIYGEGSQGGALKILLNDADPTGFYGKAELSAGSTHNGGINSTINAMANVPINDSWAVRFIGTRKEHEGFVDYSDRGTKNENDSYVSMGRIHLDGQISDRLSVSSMYLNQALRAGKPSAIQLDGPDLNNVNTEEQFADIDLNLLSVNLNYDLDFATLTSATSYYTNDRTSLSRFPFIGVLIFIFAGGELNSLSEGDPADNEWLLLNSDQYSIAQEFRLVSSPDSSFHWITGLFYRKKENDHDFHIDNDQGTYPEEAGTGVSYSDGRDFFEQIALFADVTFPLAEDWEMQAGLRVAYEKIGQEGFGEGRGAGYALYLTFPESDENARLPFRRFTGANKQISPKVSLSWMFHEDHMAYALFANGVRSGGANTNALISDITPLFDPDYLWTSEIGLKTSWLDGLLTANVAAFYNDWTDLQVFTTTLTNLGDTVPSNLALILNVGQAYSTGIEVEVFTSPLDGLTISTSLSRMKGVIIKGDDEQIVADGTLLPQLSELSYAAQINYEFLALGQQFGFTPYINASMQHTDDRLFSPPSTLPEVPLKGFETYDMAMGLQGDKWNLSLSVKNITDVRAQIGGNLLDLANYYILEPRNVRLKLGFNFE